ncbi:hypothetical protein F5Y16DRAFT_65999 [Xylariaceae sp. FL0255]|nr:hypothetical protein F5Y16DRAFT_65999 [Xylariaceae sp. FL0255]
MPTYLCHGFRWHRQSVRYFIAKHDVEDGATEWIVAPRSQDALLERFYELYDFLPPLTPTQQPPQRHRYRRHQYAPSNDSSYVSRTSSSEHRPSEDLKFSNENGTKTRSSSKSLSRPQTGARDETTQFAPVFTPPLLSPLSLNDDATNYFNDFSPIKMLEEFDPKDESRVSGPWAYVADHVIKVSTSVSIADEMFQYEARTKRDPNKAMQGPSDEYGRKVLGGGSKKAGWFEKLRDQLQRGESIRWYVVVCGDEERENPSGYDDDDELLEEDEEDEYVQDEEAIEDEELGGEEMDEESFRTPSKSNPQEDRAWVRQSRSTQSTEATSTTTTTTTGATSVIEGGFEYRIPELAGLIPRAPALLPERKRNQLRSISQKELPRTPTSPTLRSPLQSPLPRDGAANGSLESYSKPKGMRSVRSTIGIRKLFSRRSTETSV